MASTSASTISSRTKTKTHDTKFSHGPTRHTRTLNTSKKSEGVPKTGPGNCSESDPRVSFRELCAEVFIHLFCLSKKAPSTCTTRAPEEQERPLRCETQSAPETLGCRTPRLCLKRTKLCRDPAERSARGGGGTQHITRPEDGAKHSSSKQ